MTCPLHTAPQSFCARCAEAKIAIEPGIDPSIRIAFSMPSPARLWREAWCDPDRYRAAMIEHGHIVPALREPLADGTGRHDAQTARIAGLEANVNEKLATIAAHETTITALRSGAAGLRDQLRETEVRRRNACATITDITDALGITGPHQGIDDSEALAAVREHVKEQRATVIAFHDEIATLRAVESVAITAARISALAIALRKALADVDPKAMSTYEQQQARREARALLEEVAR